MNKSLKKEIVFASAVGAFVFRKLGFQKLSTAFAGFGVAAAFIPTKPVDFANKNVVITGGSRGLGLALAEEFAAKGANLALIARDRAELARASQRLSKKSRNVCTFLCDITNEEELARAINDIVERFGVIDVLVNNAGAIMVAPYNCTSEEDFRTQMELHLYAPMRAMNLAIPYLKLSDTRRIINICSMGGKVAVPHMLPYDTSKFALAGFSQGMCYEMAKDKIVVTTVYPGLMRTGSPIQAVFKGDHRREYAWFASGDVLPGLSWPADKAAREIVKASAIGKTEVILSVIAKFRMGAAAFFPELMGSIFSVMNRMLPKGTSKSYQTGAMSGELFDSSIVLKPLKSRAQTVEQRWNQLPKSDAVFNLSLGSYSQT